jgi:hypothetical protein
MVSRGIEDVLRNLKVSELKSIATEFVIYIPSKARKDEIVSMISKAYNNKFDSKIKNDFNDALRQIKLTDIDLSKEFKKLSVKEEKKAGARALITQTTSRPKSPPKQRSVSPKRSPQKQSSPRKSPPKQSSPRKSPQKQSSPRKSPQKQSSPRKSPPKQSSPRKSPPKSQSPPKQSMVLVRIPSPRRIPQEIKMIRYDNEDEDFVAEEFPVFELEYFEVKNFSDSLIDELKKSVMNGTVLEFIRKHGFPSNFVLSNFLIDMRKYNELEDLWYKTNIDHGNKILLEQLEQLYGKGARVDIRSERNQIFKYAIKKNDIRAISVLVPFFRFIVDEETQYEILQGNFEIFKYCIDNGFLKINIDLIDKLTKEKSIKPLEYILEKGILSKDKIRKTSKYIENAIRKNNLEMVKLLHQYDANIVFENALTLALRNQNPEDLIDYLIENGNIIDHKTIAVGYRKGKSDITKYLVEKYIEQRNPIEKLSVLVDKATRENDIRMLRYLDSKDVPFVLSPGWNIKSFEMFEYLTKKGLDPFDAFYLAVSNDQLDVVKHIINRLGIDPRSRDDKALRMALLFSSINVATYLLEWYYERKLPLPFDSKLKAEFGKDQVFTSRLIREIKKAGGSQSLKYYNLDQ